MRGGQYILNSLITSNNQQDKILVNYQLLEESLQKRCKTAPFFTTVQTHDSYVKKYYKPIMPIANEFRQEIAETGDLGFGPNRFSLNTYGDFTGEIYINITLTGLSVLNPLDRCGYVDMLGHKIIKKITMNFAGIVVDEYTGNAMDVYYNYFITDDKKHAYLRAIGQETPEYAYVQQDNTDQYRIRQKVFYGAQTPKILHDRVELTIPVIFDFCLRPHSSIFSSKIPFGQKYLEIELADAQDLIFVQNNGGGGQVNLPNITGNINVNNIFLDQQIVQQLKPNVWRSTIRVFKEETHQGGTSGLQKLDQIRYPVERIYFGMKPAANTGPTDWYKFHQVNYIPATFPIRIGPVDQLAFRATTIQREGLGLLSAKFLTKNVEIINDNNHLFYSAMQPLYKGVSPADPGLMMYCFAKDSFTDEPSSYYNVSVDREFYIQYTAQTGGELYVLAYCINFLEINNNGLVYLKYKS